MLVSNDMLRVVLLGLLLVGSVSTGRRKHKSSLAAISGHVYGDSRLLSASGRDSVVYRVSIAKTSSNEFGTNSFSLFSATDKPPVYISGTTTPRYTVYTQTSSFAAL